MKLPSLPVTLKRGVGRRILGYFMLAGIIPVAFTAALAYREVSRGMQDDAEKMLTLADALPEIDLVGTPYVSEFPSKTYDIHSLRLTLSSTVKHIWSLTTNSKNLRYQMELIATVSGGRQKQDKHKRISGIVCVIDPLRFSGEEIERLKIYGDYQVPVKWTSSSMIGGNAPYTVAGALVQNIAQFLAGWFR